MRIGFLTERQNEFEEIVALLKKKSEGFKKSESNMLSRNMTNARGVFADERDGCTCENGKENVINSWHGDSYSFDTLSMSGFLSGRSAPGGVDVIVCDIAYLEEIGQDIIKKIFSECRERAIAAVIGVPEYPEQMCEEIIDAYKDIMRLRKSILPQRKIIEEKRDESVSHKSDLRSTRDEPVFNELDFRSTRDEPVFNESDLCSTRDECDAIKECGEFETEKESEFDSQNVNVNEESMRLNGYINSSHRIFRIGVAGVGEGAGASFISMAIALEAASQLEKSGDLATIISVGDTDVFEMAGIEKKFMSKPFFRFIDAVRGNSNIRGIKNIEHSVNWIVRSPEDICQTLTSEEKRRLLYKAEGNLIIWDFEAKKEAKEILSMSLDLDMLIFVIDPLPSKIMTYYDIIEAAQSVAIPVKFIVNKDNNGVKKHQMLSFLKSKSPVFLPYIEPEYIYDAEYNGIPPYRIKEVRRRIQKDISVITSELCAEIM